MKTSVKVHRHLAWILLGCLAPSALAQFPGFGGMQSGRSRTGSSGYNTEPRQYRSNTMLGDAMIQIDQETRSLIIVTDETTNEQIQQLIQSIDRPKPQVLLEVLFIEVTDRDSLDFGIEGSYKYTHDGINEGSVGTAFNMASLAQGGFYRVVADDWEVTLRALEEKGKLKVLSRPSIVARNNQEAVMMVGQEVPFVTNTRTTDQGNIINTIQYGEVGIILRVTPYITQEGLVEMIVHPEISTLTDETVPVSENLESPIIAKREAETVVVTPDGKTVVIGGLIDTTQTEAVRKVPILGDIPLLGYAFRRTVRQDTRTELLIFMTPRIIETPQGLLAATKERVKGLKLAPKAVPEEDLQKFLDSLEPDQEGEAGQPGLDPAP